MGKTVKPEVVARRREVMELRVAGATFRQIGQAVGISTYTALRDYQAVMEEHREMTAAAARHHIQLQQDRLDTLLRALQGKIQEGDVKAIRAAVAIEQRRARLLGLDATADETAQHVPVSFTLKIEKPHDHTIDAP